ncbi:dehalogenase [candidate division KSB1 bacterium]
MQFFNSGFFWFIEGILFCLVIAGFYTWTREKGILMTFWKWVLFFGWILLFGFTIAFTTTSLGENEPAAALRGGILFGIITILSGVGLWRFIISGSKTK